MSRKRIVIVTVSLAMIAGSGQPCIAAASYPQIVVAYRTGQFLTAVADLLRMPADRLRDDADDFVRAATKARDDEMLRAATMLHTEAALALRLESGAGGSGEWVVHGASARRAAKALDAFDPHSPFVRQWRLLMSAFLQGQGDLFAAMHFAAGSWGRLPDGLRGSPIVIRALEPLPDRLTGDDDAELRLAMGAIQETAWVREHEYAAGRGRGDLGAAERDLRRALALRPDLLEARIRLGRVLTLREDFAAAARTLEEIDPRGLDQGFLYLAKLFKGDAEERLGRAAAAEADYRAAIAVFATAQSARIALAHLHHAQGDRRAAAAAVREGADPLATSEAADPWLWYLRGTSWRVEGYVNTLRQMTSAPAGPAR